ncbi:MAG: antibiotic biosynthesis monooxygenase [Treponema sp.]|nr:antibiotic biosynthesis monooxygenase [Treponema sp.]
MSITVNLHYTGKDGSARKFAQEMISSGTVEKIRAEKGNLRYEYYLPFNAAGEAGDEVLLIDSWESQEAIDAHHASPMMKTIAALRDKYDLHMTVERFVSDENGVPEADKDFIRK